MKDSTIKTPEELASLAAEIRAVADKIYDILVRNAGADDTPGVWNSRRDFRHFFNETPGTEYRFQGLLGFGGKFYRERQGWRVSCYSEDRNPVRDAAIAATNEKLAALKASIP